MVKNEISLIKFMIRNSIIVSSIIAIIIILNVISIPSPVQKYTKAHAAYTLYSNPTDIARFIIELMGPVHVSGMTVDVMLTPRIIVNKYNSWGLGIGLQYSKNSKFIWQWGDRFIYKNIFIADKDNKIGVVIMTNGSSGHKILKEIAWKAIGGDHYTYWEKIPMNIFCF